jgi:Ni,Fe-hydrogenase III large subunit
VRDLEAFVVPDARLARGAGLDLEAAGLRPVATPRHATVLVVVGPLPEKLATAAAVAYAQMPRPRAILAVSSLPTPGLPEPDVAAPRGQEALQAGVDTLRRVLAAGAFAPDVEAAESAAVQTRTEFVCPMHPEIVRDEPGTCPLCGMDLVPRETASEISPHTHDHGRMDAHAEAPDRHETAGDAYTCPMHPEIVQPDPGRCPICGMNLVPREDAVVRSQAGDEATPLAVHAGHEPAATTHVAHAAHDMGHAEHDAHAAAMPDEPPMDHAMMGHGDMGQAPLGDRQAAAHAAMDHGEHANHTATAMTVSEADAAMPEMDLAAMGHAGMDEGTMDHSMHGGGFMSMVAMTEHLPRSADGLPMEWVEAPFGPLFPGLPGGLDVTFTLDGDGVAEAAATVATERGVEATWLAPIEIFPDRLAAVDPLAPVAYRLLARRALEAAAGVEIDQSVAYARMRDAEWERVGSHLGWLAEFGALIGDEWIADRAAEFQIAAARGLGEPSAKLLRQIRNFASSVARAPLISRRLEGIGTIEPNVAESVSGPVARAAGIATDARLEDGWHQALGFMPVAREGGDALARLYVRLAEIAVSLDLVLAADEYRGEASDPPLSAHLSGAGQATIETPRGTARLRIVAEHGSAVEARLESPSTALIRLVPDVSVGEEVADALVAVASLDLSPWEVTP